MKRIRVLLRGRCQVQGPQRDLKKEIAGVPAGDGFVNIGEITGFETAGR
jgi:hypothetical protein